MPETRSLPRRQADGLSEIASGVVPALCPCNPPWTPTLAAAPTANPAKNYEDSRHFPKALHVPMGR